MEQSRSVFPIVDWMKAYRKEWLRHDVLAGLTTAAVVIPKAMAYAAIAGLPLVVGLYTSLVMLVVYAVLGTSPLLNVTTTATLSILAAGILNTVVPGSDPAALMTATVTLSFFVGVFLFAAGLLRLGVVANLISDPVLSGFKAGIGIVIVLDQLPKLLGIHITKTGFFRDIASIFHHLPDASMATLLLSVIMLALMFALEHYAPKLPAPLITVAGGIAASYLLGLEGRGISLVGTVQAGLPKFSLPDFSLWQQLWPAALGIALMSFVESAAAGRAFVPKGTPPPVANRELIATGAGNLIGGFFQIMPGGGGTTQTAVNQGAGAKSQISGLVCAVIILATLLFLAPLFGMMPNATLAAVVIVASIGLIRPAEFRAIRKVRVMEFRWALVAVVGILVLGTLKGILAAVMVSLVGLIVRANRYPVHIIGRKPGTNVYRPISPEHPQDETIPGLLILRPEGSIYFGNAPRVARLMRSAIDQANPRVVALDLRAVVDLEYTALQMLTSGEEKARERGSELWLVAINPQVLAVIERSHLGQHLGHDRMFFKLEDAINHYLKTYGTAPSATAGT